MSLKAIIDSKGAEATPRGPSSSEMALATGIRRIHRLIECGEFAWEKFLESSFGHHLAPSRMSKPQADIPLRKSFIFSAIKTPITAITALRYPSETGVIELRC